VVLPALVQSVARLAVVVDTSASMSPATLEQALAEIRGILAAQQGPGTGLAVLSCDTAVQSAERVFSATQVHLPGGGGTDLRIGLAAALDLRPRPQVVIVVTDGLTPWPDRPPRLPTIVALIGDGPSAPNWARTVRIPQSAPKS
jgi:predicted metal-dependent peptidase